MYYQGCKWVKEVKDIPIDETHYVIMEFGVIHIPGDERSRQHPGHGYPASIETKIDYVLMANREDWESEIAKRLSEDNNFKNWAPLVVKRPEIQTSFQIKIKE